MKKNVKREISTEKIYKISKSKEKYNQKYCAINSAEIEKSKKSYLMKVNKNENNSKNKNNSKKKPIFDKDIKNLVKNKKSKPVVQRWYSKKKDESNNIHIICGMYTIKKKQLSFTQKGIKKFINKIPNKVRKIEKKKSVLYNLSKCSDIDFEKENEEDNVIKMIDNTDKNKIINEKNKSNYSNLKINNTINKNKNRFVIFPRRFQCKNDNKKKSEREKTISKRDKNKEDKSFRKYVSVNNNSKNNIL